MRGLGRPYLPDHGPRRPAASGVTVYASAYALFPVRVGEHALAHGVEVLVGELELRGLGLLQELAQDASEAERVV